MNDSDGRPPGDDPDGAVKAELRRREQAGPGRDMGPADTPRQSPRAGPGSPGSAEYRVVDPDALYRRIERMIDEKGGQIVAEIDNVAERVAPVSEALQTISARVEDEKRVIGILDGFVKELHAVREAKERLDKISWRAAWRRRNIWFPLKVVAIVIMLGMATWGGMVIQRDFDVISASISD